MRHLYRGADCTVLFTERLWPERYEVQVWED